jgi:hypothetical protein
LNQKRQNLPLLLRQTFDTPAASLAAALTSCTVNHALLLKALYLQGLAYKHLKSTGPDWNTGMWIASLLPIFTGT